MKVSLVELAEAHIEHQNAIKASIEGKSKELADRTQATGLAFSYLAKHYAINMLERK